MYELSIDRVNFKPLAIGILGNGQYLRFRAFGSSMLPFIKSGDVLSVSPVRKMRRGDVVLYCADDDRMVVHRVTCALGNGKWLVQGDALSKPDGVVFGRNILGCVVALDRSGRRIPVDTGIHRWLGLLWLSTLPLSRRIYLELVKLKAKIRSRLRT